MKRGFTLIELLLVIAILGIITMVILPNFAAIGSTQAALAAQDAIRLLRYGRNMAILNQAPVDVTFGANGTLSVVQQGRAAAIPFSSEVSTARDKNKIDIDSDEDDEEEPPEGIKVKIKDGVNTTDLEDVNISKDYTGIAYTFLEYTDDFGSDTLVSNRTGFASLTTKKKRSDSDTLDEEPLDAEAPTGKAFSLTIQSNGVCRPFKIRIHDIDLPDSGFVLTVDMLCTGSLEEL